MSISNVFTRILFSVLSLLFFVAYSLKAFSYAPAVNAAIGAAIGLLFSLVLFSTDLLFRKVSLKTMNTTALGLFFGYAAGQAVLLCLSGLFQLGELGLTPQTVALLQGAILIFCFYSGVVLTFRAAEEIYMSIPFIKLKPTAQKKKDIVLDISILSDSRIIDLVSSGLLDSHLILPRFVLKQLYEMAEGQNEALKGKARRALEVVKKMEEIPSLDMRYNETDFPEIKDLPGKLVRLARFLDAHLLTADMSQIEQSTIEGVRIINMHTIAKALKPLTQTGEFIQIKVQRYGKEPRQGIGYLDDGTMVVINGGAEYIGETIKVQVLSVKHTSSGRMIFCNALDELTAQEYQEKGISDVEQTAKSYFAL